MLIIRFLLAAYTYAISVAKLDSKSRLLTAEAVWNDKVCESQSQR